MSERLEKFAGMKKPASRMDRGQGTDMPQVLAAPVDRTRPERRPATNSSSFQPRIDAPRIALIRRPRGDFASNQKG